MKIASLEILPEKVAIDLDYGSVNGPFGLAFVARSEARLCFVGFGELAEADFLPALAKNWPMARPRRNSVMRLDWAAPQRVALSGTAFQLSVWRALAALPFGQTITYQQLAQGMEHPSAVRAVASAVGANPVCGFIPCHRVLRKDGRPGGYRWGLDAKQRLLAAEGVRLSG